MSHVPLWEAIDQHATAWAATPAFDRFAAQLPRRAPQRQTGLPGLLQHLQAGGGWVGSMPLRLGFTTPWLLEEMPGVDAVDLGVTLTSWLEDAQRVESAHRDTVAWLRSRLPGYPMLPAPQLAPGTPLTTEEFTWRLIWKRDERSRGLQMQPAPPPGVASALQVAEDQQRRLDESARALAGAFARTDEWGRLAAAADALDGNARANLRLARATLKQRLAADAVTAHEPRLAMPRDRYRRAVLSEEIEALAGSAREYADAFDAADHLVETAASDVFGQLAAYGEPSTFGRPQELDMEPGRPSAVSFALADDSWPETGMVVWVDDPLTPDAVHITGVSMNIDRATGVAQRVTGTVLTGTAAAWRPTV